VENPRDLLLDLDAVRVLRGTGGGRYPHGNSVVVHGRDSTLIIDPSLSLADAVDVPTADSILISHCHEDHLAGVGRYPDASLLVHDADKLGLDSIDGLMRIYGLPSSIEEEWRDEVLKSFHYTPRPDAAPYGDGDTIDLGNARLHVIHLPGHTRGHSGILIEPHGVMYLADIDLTGFGPYYGDAWSSLDDFERTLRKCRDLDARWFVTFHHRGVVDGRQDFLALLAEYEAVIPRREQALLDFLDQPRTLDDIVAHRFVYRPHVTLLFVDGVERRSAELHLERLLARGEVIEMTPGTYLRATSP